jgi:hypothetical protein
MAKVKNKQREVQLGVAGAGRGRSNRNIRVSEYFTIITLNINVLNFPVKTQRLSDWIKK